MQSSPRPVSRNRSPSMPLVCASRCRVVTVRVTSASATLKSGRYVTSGRSRSTLPSSTSCITNVAVQTLVIEPIWNSESGVASTPVRMFRTPYAASPISSPSRIARVAPGTPCLSASSASRSCHRVMSSVIRTSPGVRPHCAARPPPRPRRDRRTAPPDPVPPDKVARAGSDFRQTGPVQIRDSCRMTTTASPARTFTVRPIQSAVAEELRVLDDAARPPREVVDADGGSPLRCCLRLSRPGERLLLASYAPLRRWAAATGADPGAYDELGPVFLHAEPCDGADGDSWPEELRGQPRVLRGYGADGRIVDGRVVDEDEAPEPKLADLLADERVAFVHARALVFGCFTFAIDRARTT